MLTRNPGPDRNAFAINCSSSTTLRHVGQSTRERSLRRMPLALCSLLLLVIPPACDEGQAQSGLRLDPVASGFEKPVHIAFHGAEMYVTEQGGTVRAVDGDGNRRLFLDLSDRINSGGGEEGLLSIALQANQQMRNVYVNFTAGRPSQTIIAEVPVIGTPLASARADDMRVLLRIEQPYRNHNGGQLAFDSEGLLYIGMGDGGAAGDPQNRAQNPRSLLGKMLRISVQPDRNRPYTIPITNPFLTRSEFAPEIYALGLRNPWRFSFDRLSGRLYAADVGQNRQEEINLINHGDNLGWRFVEGELCYRPENDCGKDQFVRPIHTYGRSAGQSITGGFVYRGRGIPNLQQHYVFADYVSGKIWALPLGADGRASGSARLIAESGRNISTFGQDADGELYVADHGKGEILRLDQ